MFCCCLTIFALNHRQTVTTLSMGSVTGAGTGAVIGAVTGNDRGITS